MDNGIPGPGSYTERDTLRNSKSASTFKFGNSKRTEVVSKTAGEQPGPGNYSGFENAMGKGPKFTLGGKPKNTNKNDHPGPGSYNNVDGSTIKSKP